MRISISLLAGLFMAGQALAADPNCYNNVAAGTTAADVIKLCGEPVRKDVEIKTGKKKINVIKGITSQTTTVKTERVVEKWHYRDMTGRSFTIWIEDGKVVKKSSQ